MPRILVVDDDKDLCESISECLKFEGYDTDTTYDSDTALTLLCRDKYDLAVLDVVLPGLSGISLCQLYRKLGGNARILLITGKGDVAEREAGLDAGADDILSKPCDMRELTAHIRALMRRSLNVCSSVLQMGRLRLHVEEFLVSRDDERIVLHPKEFALLAFFMKNPNIIFTTQSLIARVWEGCATIDTVRTHIKTLRKKIDHPSGVPQIKTVYGLGYCFTDSTES